MLDSVAKVVVVEDFLSVVLDPPWWLDAGISCGGGGGVEVGWRWVYSGVSIRGCVIVWPSSIYKEVEDPPPQGERQPTQLHHDVPSYP